MTFKTNGYLHGPPLNGKKFKDNQGLKSGNVVVTQVSVASRSGEFACKSVIKILFGVIFVQH